MNLTYDPVLDLATASTRKSKIWKNKKAKWSTVLERLSTTTRTPETMAEYRAMGREQQADMKDVGGFVGGYCVNGSRSNVKHRSLLCLDADYADDNLWPDWELLYGAAAAVYSTHKHTPDKQRLRLVIPLSRNVDPDEYQAIGRKVAFDLGIEKFDDTTYEAGRLMFWPSTSRDGEYVFQYLDAPVLDADKVLSTYQDWRDISAWPMSSRVADIQKKAGTKQQDPKEKSGLIGAFCRAYSITEAIETFVPEYVPCDIPGRYTYTGGSTAAGVVVYEDKFAYSHHATDPSSGVLVNAWDLVRLHKFADLDADIEPDTPTGKRPSYKAMEDLAAGDERVKVQLVNDRLEEAQTDFADPAPEDGDPDAWKTLLKVTKNGDVAASIENAVVILQNDPAFKGALAFNELTHDIVATRSLPWREIKQETSQWTDSDDASLRFYLEKFYGLTSKDRIFDAVNVVAQKSTFHPVRDYLSGCTWDGVPRVETLLIDYLGAEDTPYTRAVTRKTLTAAVSRVYRPGCKFDYMLTLRGRQGLGKSALIAKLGGQWFSDTFSTIQGKEAYEQVLGVWIMEVGELAGMRKAEAETIKLYISKQSDRFRPAYGRRTQEYPRQCIFIGTTNENEFLRDTTGNRRFWVVDTPNEPRRSLWDEMMQATVDLIWGEAVEMYRAGEKLYLPPELEEEARKIQESYAEENPKTGLVLEYLDRLLPENWDSLDTYARREWLGDDLNADAGTVQRRYVSTVEIWAEAMKGNPDKLDRYAIKEIRDIMAAIPGWRRVKDDRITINPYGRQRYYERRPER